MPRFRVAIAPGVSHIVDADNEDEAKKKTRAEIAKGAVSPFMMIFSLIMKQVLI